MSTRSDGALAVFDRSFLILLAATLLAAILVTIKSGLFHTAEITLGAFGFMVILLPKIFAGVIIAATIPVLIPRDRIAAAIGQDSGWRGLVLASFAGAMLPGGPSMTFPLAASLMASGADIGASLALITGWCLFSLNRTLIWELSFLPPEFVGLRVLLSLPIPILVGLAARGLVRR